MDVLILAAGRGDRLRPITDRTPKPLLEIAGKPLIEHHIERLVAAGHRRLVINLAHLGEAIEERVGDGGRLGARVSYSREPPGALETGGGIVQALPLLGDAPFLVVNGDIFTDFRFARLRSVKCDHAHLVLVPVPADRAHGDFALVNGRVHNTGEPAFTFSGISLYHPRFFKGAPGGRWSVVPLLREAVERQQVTGEQYAGSWHDVGTAEKLRELRGSG